jgi:hypothetical protein
MDGENAMEAAIGGVFDRSLPEDDFAEVVGEALLAGIRALDLFQCAPALGIHRECQHTAGDGDRDK